MAMPSLRASEGGVVIRVRVQPKSSRNAITLESSGRIRVALTAPPVDGAANASLLKHMARFLGVKRRELSLHSGGQSREKSLFLTGYSLEEVRARIDLCAH